MNADTVVVVVALLRPNVLLQLGALAILVIALCNLIAALG